MTERNLAILVTARNMAHRVLGGVKGDINGIEGAAKRAGSNMGRNIAIGAGVAAAGIATQVKAGVDSLVELERVEHLTAAALASTGNTARQSVAGIRARAEELENLTGVDDKIIQNAENLLLTFSNIGPKAFEPTLESAVNLNAALGGDDESLQGVLLQVAKAVNDPIRGMTALRRSGVSFTEAQQDQVRELVEANDLMGAQAIVLGELEKQFGGAAEAANTGALRAQRRWADGVEDIQKSLATGFMPLIERVSDKMSELVADPEFLARVQGFGETLASGFDEALDFAESVDWGAVGNAFSTMGSGARMAMDAFLGAPPWLQTAILTGWGLNKLTGGAVGSLVGELGKGLVKGVLGINAGVVNVKGAVVNAPGGGVGGSPLAPAAGAGGAMGGLRGFLNGPVGRAVAVAGPVLAGIAVNEAIQFDAGRDRMVADTTDKVTDVRILSADDLTARIDQVQGIIDEERPFLEGILFNTNVKPALEAGIDSLRSQQAAAATSITRGTEGQTNLMRGESMRAASFDRAMLDRYGQSLATDRASLSKQAEALAAVRAQGGTLAQIRDKKSSFNIALHNATTVLLDGRVLGQVATARRLSNADSPELRGFI